MSSNIDKKKNKIPTSVPKTCAGAKWLGERWPNVRLLDRDWTMERYDYPDFVRQYIKDNWVEVSSRNGGTYAKPCWWDTQTPAGKAYLVKTH